MSDYVGDFPRRRTGTKVQRIAICGSMRFLNQMTVLGERLRDAGLTVTVPAKEETQIDYSGVPDEELARVKRGFIDGYLKEIEKADAILVANFDQRGIKGYVGANTLMEVAFAYALKKRIFVLNALGPQPCRPEILGLQPVFIGEKLHTIISILSEQEAA